MSTDGTCKILLFLFWIWEHRTSHQKYRIIFERPELKICFSFIIRHHMICYLRFIIQLYRYRHLIFFDIFLTLIDRRTTTHIYIWKWFLYIIFLENIHMIYFVCCNSNVLFLMTCQLLFSLNISENVLRLSKLFGLGLGVKNFHVFIFML